MSSRVPRFAAFPLVAVALGGCMSAPPAQAPARLPLLAYPTFTGVAQVRDAGGAAVWVPCNPCTAPTPKTAVPAAVRPAVSVAAAPVVAVVAPVPVPAPARVEVPAPVVPALALVAQVAPATPLAETRTLHFASALARLGPQGRKALAELAPLALKAETIRVRGYTDSSGSAAANRVLAQRRAETVRDALVAAGVPAAQIATSSCAACYLAPNDTTEGRQQNRRVEVVLSLPRAVMVSRAPGLSTERSP